MVYCQAEGGIRDVAVTGVQTCALPISSQPVRQRPSSWGSPTRISTLRSARIQASPAGRLAACALRSPVCGRARQEIGRAACWEGGDLGGCRIIKKKNKEIIVVHRR